VSAVDPKTSGRSRLAAVQAAPVFLDREATIAKGVSLIEEAAEGAADLPAVAAPAELGP
jgi:hypothetical protein